MLYYELASNRHLELSSWFGNLRVYCRTEKKLDLDLQFYFDMDIDFKMNTKIERARKKVDDK